MYVCMYVIKYTYLLQFWKVSFLIFTIFFSRLYIFQVSIYLNKTFTSAISVAIVSGSETNSYIL